MPPGVLRSELYLAYVHSQTNSQTWIKFGANRSSRLTDCSDFWMCDSLNPPPKCPLGYCGRILFSLYLFPDESADGYQMWCQSVQPFDSLPSILNVWPPNPLEMPPGVLRGELYLAYVHSQTNPQTCTKYGANRSNRLTASPYFWIFDPLKRPKCPPLCVSGGNLFGVYPFPDESADMNQSWW